MNTSDYLEAVRALTKTKSDYAIAKALSVPQSQIIGYKKGTTFGVDMCEKIAEVLNTPIEAVLADMEAERAKRTTIKEAWQRAADMLRNVAAVVLLMVFTVGAAPTEAASFSNPVVNNIHYAQLRIFLTRLIGLFKALFSSANFMGKNPGIIPA